MLISGGANAACHGSATNAGLGWIPGRNVHFETRLSASDPNRTRAYAKELIEMVPDVILAHTTLATAAVLLQTKSIPTVFVVVSDPQCRPSTPLVHRCAWQHARASD